MFFITTIFIGFFLLRLISLAISIKHEKQLIKQGATQYGKKTSMLLTLAHVAYYGAVLYEGWSKNITFNAYSCSGILIMLFAYAMLFYVIHKLGPIWTVKLYIAPNHQIDNSFLFRTIKHPNYFLNIIPELIGVALLCNAWYTLIIGFPLYCLFLSVRITQEEKVMRKL